MTNATERMICMATCSSMQVILFNFPFDHLLLCPLFQKFSKPFMNIIFYIVFILVCSPFGFLSPKKETPHPPRPRTPAGSSGSSAEERVAQKHAKTVCLKRKKSNNDKKSAKHRKKQSKICKTSEKNKDPY